jgi:hypothetical protein
MVNEDFQKENTELKAKLAKVLQENENLTTANYHLNNRVQKIVDEMNAVASAGNCLIGKMQEYHNKIFKSNHEYLWYFAHPYSGKSKMIEKANFEMCCSRATKLLDNGYNIYAPICHTHPIEQYKNQPWEFWLSLDKLFVDRCDGLILAPGWEYSKGCLQEKAWFEKAGKPIKEYGEIIENK